MTQQPLFELGFTNLDSEIQQQPLAVTGIIPAWLSGTLFRNGPAKFTTAQGWHTHWFDGLAMLHKFTFGDARVHYSNKFLRSNAYHRAMETGELGSGFGSVHGRKTTQGNNANVNLSVINGHYVAMTETPAVVEFDPFTLDTIDVLPFDNAFPGQFTTAHPHIDFKTRDHLNFTIDFGRTSSYQFYSIGPNSTRKEFIGSIPVLEPSYIHSFAVTEHYIVLAEFPFVVNPQELVSSGKSFIENFHWKPEQGTRFHVIQKSDGALLKTFESEAFFSFHHVNAYEYGGELIVDLCASRTAGIVGSLQVDKLTSTVEDHHTDDARDNFTELRRYRLPLHQSSHSSFISGEVLSSETMDLPTVNDARCGSRSYRYAYGISTNQAQVESFSNQLVKADVHSGASKVWYEAGCYPGEPIFVERPHAKSEDDGVILSVVLDGKQGHSFLLILDAVTFQELGKVHVPHHIPFGFHGMFTEELFIRHR
ncbi:carotenoid oxygenase family protein [Paenibacillus rigui]|uniref:Beta-carotene 15,15'-monooxygenase n=1 Tax=Paenibacillus rigui TaxID=554312 RepID=A0A229ULR6_9BACL|nr:carotenoid oxygenase family protein [Paenibacillus rigui]OXM84323.1 beta-carotene 15,15'-monooxygenase [Paenibacillus rigui]